MKKASLICFTLFYIASFFTCNFPYPEYAKYPVLSFFVSLLTVIAFLFVTKFYSYSKKFLIAISIYFSCVFVAVMFLTVFDGWDITWYTIPIILLFLSYTIPITAVHTLLERFSLDVPSYVVFIFLLVVVYSVYYIFRWKSTKNKKIDT